MFDAKPEDREQIALYVQEIETDHKPGPDGNLIAVDKITFGKKGTANYQQIYEVGRLQKDNPMLWDYVKPVYMKWKQSNEITTDGMPLEAWPAITKGQIKACRNIGLRSVEDLAKSTDSVREKLGMGSLDLINKAKKFLETREQSATANRVADLEKQVETLISDLKESRETIDTLMANRGRRPGRPKNSEKAE